MCSWSKEGVAAASVGVFLVGTGLGDPEFLTLKAYRVIQNADLLLYDRLMSNDALELVDSGARLFYVGKTARYHSKTQVVLHELLLSFAEAEVGDLQIQLQNSSAGCHVLCSLHVGSALVIHLVAFVAIFN
ncbi:hypothetical protein ACE6H2_020923 [Prunus campanulata]